jgi:hypothetical protein
MTRRVVFLGPLFLEESLGAPVAPLLLQIRSNRITTVVPYDSSWGESQLPIALLKAPADIYIIASDPKTFVETTNFKQRGFTIRHVTAWNVLCLAIG